MRYLFHSATHIGKVKENNEDFFLNAEIEEGHVFVVCDGMGGHNGGEIAARIAAQSVIEFFSNNEISDIPKSLNSALTIANKSILSEASKYPALQGMGTTLVVIIISNLKSYLAHIGDSRAYAIFNNEIIPLTKDHSLVVGLIDSGEITEIEALTHPRRNLITKALGNSFDPKYDYFDGEISLPENSYLLLCTDGLNGMINEQEILETFSFKDPKRICELLIQKALDSGGGDNITVSVLRVDSSDDKSFAYKSDVKPKRRKNGLLNLLFFKRVIKLLKI